MRSLLLLFVMMLSVAGAAAQRGLKSHEVHADGSITFRVYAPVAKKVSVTVAGMKPVVMTHGEDGVWSGTTAPLPPEIYSYSTTVDGVSVLDPLNAAVVPNLLALTSEVTVTGATAMPWEMAAIPHGRVDKHVYTTHVAQHLPLGQETYFVYTPPGYDAKRDGGYPVLYLLHGWSDLANGWDVIGRAPWMLDSMIAVGKAVPMIVVMPMAYGDYDFVQHGFSAWSDPAKVAGNTGLFDTMLETEIRAQVEHEYNVATGRENRAIAGLSMGGLETLTTAFRHPEEYAWVGAFSAAVFQGQFDKNLPPVDAKTAKFRLLWVSVGSSDLLVKPNRDLVAWSKAKGFDVTWHETDGGHTWLVWRDNLLQFAPLLFRK